MGAWKMIQEHAVLQAGVRSGFRERQEDEFGGGSGGGDRGWLFPPHVLGPHLSENSGQGTLS